MNPRILCVDDNTRNLRILNELLEDDYELENAENGMEALERFDAFRPSLVLLDVMMPDIDGYEVCRRIREHEHGADVPVVLVTARAREDEREMGMTAGASAYLAKPFDPDALLDLVEEFVPTENVS